MKWWESFWKWVGRIGSLVTILWFISLLWRAVFSVFQRVGLKMIPSSSVDWLIFCVGLVGFLVSIVNITISIKREKLSRKKNSIMEGIKRGLLGGGLLTFKEYEEQNKRRRQDFAKKHIKDNS